MHAILLRISFAFWLLLDFIPLWVMVLKSRLHLKRGFAQFKNIRIRNLAFHTQLSICNAAKTFVPLVTFSILALLIHLLFNVLFTLNLLPTGGLLFLIQFYFTESLGCWILLFATLRLIVMLIVRLMTLLLFGSVIWIQLVNHELVTQLIV